MQDSLGNYAASLSLNQINWDGINEHLPSWDDVAGDPTDYSRTYDPTGNTLVLLSMNVAPMYKGLNLPSKMVDQTKILTQSLGVSHLIGSFRPSGYGEIKKRMTGLDFQTYCMMKRWGGEKPVDSWLGSLWHMGMIMLTVDPRAMTVQVTLEEFLHYQKTYKPDVWYEVEPYVWECAEVGQWNVDLAKGIATYKESNIWGSLPIK